MDPWWNLVTPRAEVRQGRSFNPDEFAIHLEQVVAGTAPEDYRNPRLFFSRTCFTRALRDHSGMVLRRLAGETENTAPVLTLITQFGGGKTHTLTALYHLATSGPAAQDYEGIRDLLGEIGLRAVPKARVGVFVGNAWDPAPGRETPWIDLARQLAGETGVAALGVEARTTPPGTAALDKVFQAAGAPVLVLFDEVLNYLNRYRGMADSFYAFLQNLTVAMTGTTHGAAVVSLPRSQVEMTSWDMEWQDKVTKVLRRVAKDLIVNDESEVSEVIRRRLFEDLGNKRVRQRVAKAYAGWCFERRSQLPPEWTAVDTATTDKKAREHLEARFKSCYPFHPATLSVFQRKWQALPQYQQTRGTLAMLAQWVSWAYRDGFKTALREPLITLGSAPLHVPDFRGVVLGQLGESRLMTAIDTDIAGDLAHAKALDAETKGALRDIHRRVGTAILFESSGGQSEKVAHLPELRFALGGPDIDTTSVDTAAMALEDRSFYIRRVGSDGYQIRHQPTLKKVVSDRRASLDFETDVKPRMRASTADEFRRGASMTIVDFPKQSEDIPDTPKLTLVLMDPEVEWTGSEAVREQTAQWTKQRGKCQLQPRMATLTASCEELRDFGALLERLRERLAREKLRPLRTSLLGADGWREDEFLRPPLLSEGDQALCVSCQRAGGRLRYGGELVCDACWEDDQIGRQLVKVRYVAFCPGEGGLPQGVVRLVSQERDIPPNAYLVLDLDGGCGEGPHVPVVGRFLARHVPQDPEGNVMDFTELAARSTGRSALAYLKADVDNLGRIFRDGLKGDERDRRSISRLSTLSRFLELFFGGHIQALAKDLDVYTVYSGGDDLLVVGPWDVLVRFALRLREDFRKFTCENPSWSLSAGLAMVGHHTPVLIAAEEAERRLEAAKSTPGKDTIPWPWGADANGEATKDRLVALGTSVPWPRLAELVARGEQVRQWLQEGALSTGHVRRLLGYAELYQHWQRTGDIMAFRYAPMMVYDIRRNWTKAPA